jgi:hypothetical protein
MNKKVFFVLLLTIIALVFVYLYSFGPLAKLRQSRSINPQSLVPTKEITNANNQKATFNIYHNKDAKENYYSIKVPADWQIIKTNKPGSYNFSDLGGTISAELMDVPDNTTLELYVLSQEEPRLKRESSGYNRIDYQKIFINGNQAYELTYRSINQGQQNVTMRTYITGQDMAGVITANLLQDQFSKIQPLIESLINSFVWENK